MNDLLARYKQKRPSIIFNWNDEETNARGWVVINSLRGGAAGGGTRMRKGLTVSEVESLAKVMEIKFTVSGPPIGGAKSGIDFDPNDPRKDEVLRRWYAAVIPLLKTYYGTGGDLNVDEIKEVIPITEDFGLWHPQEGVVNGHFQPRENQKIHQIGQLRQGVSKKVEDPAYSPDTSHGYVVADLITGWGVSESVRHYYDVWKNESLAGKRVIVQGWGNVGGAAAYYLAKLGAKVVGIVDRAGGLIDTDGLGEEAVRTLLLERDGTKLNAPDMLSFDEANERIWQVGADIFIPAAASKLVTRDQITALMDAGLECVSAGANVPFRDEDIFFGEVAGMVDDRIALVPDFIANCGMARAFGYLMQPEAQMTDAAIFSDSSQCIRTALEAVHAENPSSTRIAQTALGVALEQLV